MSVRSPESRRISLLLVERRVSGVAMVGVLSTALLFGLVGFAIHALGCHHRGPGSGARVRGGKRPSGS
jgi:hypothetical protein